jgi:hypothetical protein
MTNMEIAACLDLILIPQDNNVHDMFTDNKQIWNNPLKKGRVKEICASLLSDHVAFPNIGDTWALVYIILEHRLPTEDPVQLIAHKLQTTHRMGKKGTDKIVNQLTEWVNNHGKLSIKKEVNGRGLDWQRLTQVLAIHNSCSNWTDEWRTTLATKIHQQDTCNIAIRHNHLIVHRQHVESITQSVIECARNISWLHRFEAVNHPTTIQQATTDD